MDLFPFARDLEDIYPVDSDRTAPRRHLRPSTPLWNNYNYVITVKMFTKLENWI